MEHLNLKQWQAIKQFSNEIKEMLADVRNYVKSEEAIRAIDMVIKRLNLHIDIARLDFENYKDKEDKNELENNS